MSLMILRCLILSTVHGRRFVHDVTYDGGGGGGGTVRL